MRTDSNLNGGTGGYIWINTINKYGENYVSNGAFISARGGTGKNQGFGGSGGVIVFGKNFRLGLFNVESSGGIGGVSWNTSIPVGCANAAAGTNYFWALDLMLIDNKNIITDKYTQLSATIRAPDDFPG